MAWPRLAPHAPLFLFTLLFTTFIPLAPCSFSPQGSCCYFYFFLFKHLLTGSMDGWVVGGINRGLGGWLDD